MPPRIVIPRTQPELQRVVPAPVESRVIALEMHVPPGGGMLDFCYTPPLGNRLWLYSIDMWAYCGDPPAMLGGFFYFTYGTSEPESAEEMIVGWKRIIPLHCGIKPGFYWFDCSSFHRRFTMAKLFTNDELRFGVVIENAVAQDWLATIAFEIAEG